MTHDALLFKLLLLRVLLKTSKKKGNGLEIWWIIELCWVPQKIVFMNQGKPGDSPMVEVKVESRLGIQNKEHLC